MSYLMQPQRLSIGTRLIRAVISLGMIGGSLAIFSYLVETRPMPGTRPPASAVQSIAALELQPMSVPRQWVGYGTARPLNSADVPARVGGVVIEIDERAKVGAAVEQGQFLVQLDDQDFRRALDAAQQQLAAIDAQRASLEVEATGLAARLTLAQEEAKLSGEDEQRVRAAFDAGAALQRERDRARQQTIIAERAVLLLVEAANQLGPRRASLEAQARAQESARDNAQRSVDRCRIVSPLSGSLQRCDLEVGENVTAGQAVARVVDGSSVEIPIRLPASARGTVAVGDPVRVTVTGPGARVFESTIARIEPEDDPVQRTLTVYAERRGLAATDRLAPGEFVEAIVSARDGSPRMVIPRRAVRSGHVLEFVGESLRPRKVSVSHSYSGGVPESGLDDEEWVVLVEPLGAGTVIAVDGGRIVGSGVRVAPVKGASR